jgi:hypothetical protein
LNAHVPSLRSNEWQSAAKPLHAAQEWNLPIGSAMVGYVRVGCELVRWDLTALRPDGPFRLAIQFANKPVVEVFDEPSAALTRLAEIEDLLAMSPSGRPS